MKTNAALLAAVRGFFEKHVNGLKTTLASQEFLALPASLQAELQSLRDSFNTTLAQLPPLDQVPAAAEAANGMDWLKSVVERLTDTADGLMAKLKAMEADLRGRVTALNELNQKITAGEYVTKAAHEAALGTARQQERDALLPEIVAARKAALELAKLPVPAEDVLKLAQADYAKRFELCQTNVKQLGDKGLTLGNHGKKFVECCAWLEADAFKAEFGKYEGLFPAAVRRTETAGDPLLGADANSPATTGHQLGKDIPVGLA